MNRRDFARLVGCAAAAWPLGARAQRRPVPVIGFLGTASKIGWSPWTDAFLRRLADLGWIDGRTVAIEYRWTEGRLERIAEFAAEFIRLKVDVIVTGGSAVPTIKRQTSEIPIVFALATIPSAAGLSRGSIGPEGM
jgi:putative ABC transport system substrate-binding protein